MADNICLTDFKKIAKEYLGSEEAVNDFADRLRNNQAVKEATSNANKAQVLGNKLKEMLDEEERAKSIRKRQYALASFKQFEMSQEIDRRAEESGKGHTFALLSRISNTLTEFKAGNLNTDTKIQAIRDDLSSEILKSFSQDEWRFLTQTKIVKGKFQPVNDEDLMNAMDGEKSASIQAKEVTGKMTAFNKKNAEYLNQLGANIQVRDDYLQRQSHSIENMLSATGKIYQDLKLRLKLLRDKTRTKSISNSMKDISFNRWKQTIQPRLDENLTFKGEDPNKFLRSAYEHMVTNINMTKKVSTDLLSTIKRPRTLASRISTGRVFRFKSHRDWYEYNKSYGTESISNSFLRHLDKTAELTGLLEDWGPNPTSNFEHQLQRSLKNDREKLVGKTGFFFSPAQVAKARFNEISHAYVTPVDSIASKMLNRLLTFERMTKLGSVLLPSFLDTTQGMANLTEHGINPLKQFTVGLGRGIKDKKEFARQIEIGGRLILGHYGSRVDPIAQRGNYENLFFKLTGIDWWDSSFRTGHGSLLLENLAQHATQPYDDLKQLKGILSLYDINEPEWNMIKKYTRNKIQGIDMLTPDGVENIPNDVIKSYKTKMKIAPHKSLQAVRRDLKLRLQSFLYDQTNNAHTFPDASTRATVKFNSLLPQSHPLMMLNRIMTQFKTWTITMTRRSILRRIVNKKWSPLFTQLGASLPLAYAVVSAKAIFNGETPPSLQKPDTWGQILTLSGGLGYIGSFIAGDYGKYGYNILASPLTGDVSAALSNIVNTLSDKNVGPSWYFMLKNNIPGANLFYLKAAINRMMFNTLGQVMLSPDYEQKVQQRMQKNTGQQFFWPM